MIRRLTYRLILLLVFFSVFEQKLKAQEYPWSLQYVTNMHTINPAYVGIWDKAGILLSTKTNYVGIHGAELTHLEEPAAQAGAGLPEQDRGAEPQPHQQGDGQEQRVQDEQAQERGDKVEGSFHERGLILRYNGCHARGTRFHGPLHHGHPEGMGRAANQTGGRGLPRLCGRLSGNTGRN